MQKFALILPIALLAACSEEPAAAPEEPVEVATPEPVEPSLPAPDAEIFSAALAKACPALEPVNKSACRRAGMTSSDVICEYGLGDDEYLRHKATLTPGDEEWTVADPETTCAQGA